MSKIDDLEKRLKEEGIKGISGAVFEDMKVSTAENPDGIRKANTTPREYCEAMANMENVTPDEFAEQILRVLDTPKSTVVGECRKCWALLVEGEEHVCGAE